MTLRAVTRIVFFSLLVACNVASETDDRWDPTGEPPMLWVDDENVHLLGSTIRLAVSASLPLTTGLAPLLARLLAAECDAGCNAAVDHGTLVVTADTAGTHVVTLSMRSTDLVGDFVGSVKVTFDEVAEIRVSRDVDASALGVDNVFLPGQRFALCHEVFTKMHGAIDVPVERTISGPVVALDARRPAGCAVYRATERGRGSIEWRFGAITHTSVVDIVDVDAATSIDIVAADPLQGGRRELAPPDVVSGAPTLPSVEVGCWSRFGVRFRTKDGRTGLAGDRALQPRPETWFQVRADDDLSQFVELAATPRLPSGSADFTLSATVGALTVSIPGHARTSFCP